jgi:type III secretion system YscD/HrpQ family protein
MTSDPTTLIELRVLYGPQAGSRLQLAAGDYLLGSSDQCAVVLSGPLIEAQHAMLVVRDDGLRLSPLDGMVCDAMGNPIGEGFVLALGMPVELGGVSIAVDRVDAAWPDARAVAPMRELPQPAHAAAAASTAAPAPGAAEPRPARQAARRGHRVGLAAIALAAVAMAGLALAWNYDGQRAAPPDEPASAQARSDEPPEALTALLRSLDPGSALTVARQPDDQWLVAGYLATVPEKKALTDALANLVPAPASRIFVDEEIRRAANDALSGREDAADGVLTIAGGGKGNLRLAGAVRHAASLQSARLALMVVPGVRDVDTSAVLLPEKLLADLKARIDAAGLKKQLVFVSEWPTVTLSGSVDETQRARFEELFKSFAQAYGDVLPVRATLNPAVPRVGFEVRTIVGGAAPYIVTREGVRVNRGGAIGGHVLSTVGDSSVVFDGPQRLQIAR